MEKIGRLQLSDPLKLIAQWNTEMSVLMRRCERATKSESVDILDDLIRLGTSTFVELGTTRQICHSLPQHMETLRLRRAAVTCGRGMKSLPTEIIGYIFTFATYHDCRTALAITHVNAEWRRKALSTPAMWSTVTFGQQTGFSTDMLSMYLERSKEVPLDIYYRALADEVFQVSFPMLITHGHRWCELSAQVRDVAEAVEAIVEGLPHPPTLPRLEQFVVMRGHYSESHPPSRHFPALRLPVIREFDLPMPYRSVDFSCFGPGLERISFIPSSLTGMESCLNLRQLICEVKADLVIEHSLRLHLPCLERVSITAHHDTWAVVSRLFRAMASCSPKQLATTIYCWEGYNPVDEPTLDPPTTLLSRVEELTVCIDGDGKCRCIPAVRINAAQILERSPMLRTVDIINVPKAHLLLLDTGETFLPNITRLEISRGGRGAVLPEEIINLLERRAKHGMQSLGFLYTDQCGRPPIEQLIRLQQLADRVVWSFYQESEDSEDGGLDEGSEGGDA